MCGQETSGAPPWANSIAESRDFIKPSMQSWSAFRTASLLVTSGALTRVARDPGRGGAPKGLHGRLRRAHALPSNHPPKPRIRESALRFRVFPVPNHAGGAVIGI